MVGDSRAENQWWLLGNFYSPSCSGWVTTSAEKGRTAGKVKQAFLDEGSSGHRQIYMALFQSGMKKTQTNDFYVQSKLLDEAEFVWCKLMQM